MDDYLEHFSFNYLHALRLFFRQALLQQLVRIYGYGPIVASRLTKKFLATHVNI